MLHREHLFGAFPELPHSVSKDFGHYLDTDKRMPKLHCCFPTDSFVHAVVQHCAWIVLLENFDVQIFRLHSSVLGSAKLAKELRVVLSALGT